MKYGFLFLFLLSQSLYAQSNAVGFGSFILGSTTPDSLHSPDFREQEQVVVKGTLALLCANIRLFKADTARVQGIIVTNLFLVFYENRLFRITCDYSEPMQKAFTGQYGKGTAKPTNRLSLCDDGKSNRITVESESWQMGDALALVVRAQGYNADCQQEQTSRLTIASQSVMAISSECDLEYLDPYFEKSWLNR